MGFFLTSEQTASREAQNTNLFTLGVQTGNQIAESQRRREAAYEQAVATTQIEQAEITRRARMQQETSLERMRAALAKFQQQTEAERTADSIKTGLDAVKGLASKFDAYGDRLISNPSAYGEPAWQELSDAKSRALGVLSEAQLAASRVKVGEMFDASPYTNQLSAITFRPTVKPEFLQREREKIETEESKQFRNYNSSQSRVKATDKAADTLFNRWEIAIGEYMGTEAAFNADVARMGGPEAYEKLRAAGETDPLASARSNKDKKYADAIGMGMAVRSDALSGKYGSDVAQMADALERQGYTPFDPRDIGRLGGLFGKLANEGASGADADRQSRIFTGRPISYWKEQLAREALSAGMSMPGLGWK